MKRNKVVHATHYEMNLENLLQERSQSQKMTVYIKVQNGEIHRDKE